jgi:hypothetical protein
MPVMCHEQHVMDCNMKPAIYVVMPSMLLYHVILPCYLPSYLPCFYHVIC